MLDRAQQLRDAASELRRQRRGLFLLPSLFTVGNLFCGYACIVYAMRGELVVAAPFIGIAFVLDALDGRIARLTNTTSRFGVEGLGVNANATIVDQTSNGAAVAYGVAKYTYNLTGYYEHDGVSLRLSHVYRKGSQSSGANQNGVTAAELAEFAGRDLAVGQRVLLPAQGLVRGISPEGELLVETAAGVVPHRAGSLVFANS